MSAISQGLRGEPCCAVLADQRDRFIDRVYAMRDGEIDLAGEFNAFAEHRAATPIDEFGPHFPDQNQRRVIKFADLEELPRKRHFQQRPDSARHNDKRIGNDHEVMEAREERAMFVGLANERIYLLLEWQMDADANRAMCCLFNRVRTFIRRLH